MKVRVKTEFKDKYTEDLHKPGEELEMTVDRINEVLKVGNFIELVVEQTEPEKETEETKETSESAEQAESEDAGEQAAEETPKPSTRRKRSK